MINPKNIAMNLSQIAPVATITGGDLHYWPMYDPFKHSEKLHYEIFRTLTRNQGFEVVIKARTGQGIALEEYYGGFGKKETTDFELAAIDADKTICFKLTSTAQLKETQFAFV
jgi:protein transport protein SEC24